MFFSSLTDRGSVPALVSTLVFSQERLKMIAENVANLNTPGYRAKQLDTQGFQGALRRALDERGDDTTRPFEVEAGDEVRSDDTGRLQVRPSLKPVENGLFHDGTNLSIERQMADLAETGMMHELATQLLVDKMGALRTAIRGRL